MHAGREAVYAELRQEIRRLDSNFRQQGAVPFGIPDVDQWLPGGGLALGALHEVTEQGPAAEFSGAATLFTAGIMSRLKGPVLWCLNRRDLFAPGLMNVGLHPARVIYAETFRERDILAVMEEGLREKGLAAVVGEVTQLELSASRRLQLAAEASGMPAFVLRRWWNVRERELTTLPNVAVTRWRIAPVMSEVLPVPGLGRARWQVELLRCRGGEPRSWILEACDAKGYLALPAHMADRSCQATYQRASIG